MLHIKCPSCGERGKIPAGLVGARIKCKKCNSAFHVAAPGKADAPLAVGAGAGTGAGAASSPSQAFEGIAVEGLDASSWSLAPDQSGLIHAVASEHHAPPPSPAEAPQPSAAPEHPAGPTREYKLLTSRDRFFEGKFDLPRLEEALNHYARQGWTAKSMCHPHIKNFQGTMQEEVVVLLER